MLAEKPNNETISQLNLYIALSKDRWQKIKYLRSGTEQLITWVALGVNAAITLLLGICLLRQSCKNNAASITIMTADTHEEKSPDQNEILIENLEEERGRLHGRIVGLEGDLMDIRLQQNTCTEITPAQGANIEEIED